MAACGLPDLARQHVLLAIGEACANSVEHGYARDSAGRIDVELADHGHHLVARIHDWGTRRPEPYPSGLRGHGTNIMRTLSTSFSRETTRRAAW